MKRSRLAPIVLTFVALFGMSISAQTPTAPATTSASRPTSTTAEAQAPRFPWTLVPPTDPCPSHVSLVATLAADLVHGNAKTTIERVTDGDTVRLAPSRESVRLLGLDTEECFKGKALDSEDSKKMIADFGAWKRSQLEGKDQKHPPKYNTPMGEAAKHGAELIVRGAEEVRVEYDDPARKVDGFGRVLAHVLVRKGATWTHVNVEMVRQGLTPYFVKYGRCARYDAAYESAQKEAQASKRGIWSEKPIYGCYDDYGVRLAWWGERARDLAEAHLLRKTREDILILGEPLEGDRLMKLEGKRISVFGSASAAKTAGELVLYGLSHLKDNDFLVVGTRDQVTATTLAKEEGNLVYVTGTVSLFKGKPQFKIGEKTPVTVSRRPPALP